MNHDLKLFDRLARELGGAVLALPHPVAMRLIDLIDARDQDKARRLRALYGALFNPRSKA